eukprot:ANDGO_00642.mRNA.1 hypothetical protein NAEGRDRAFT_80368
MGKKTKQSPAEPSPTTASVVQHKSISADVQSDKAHAKLTVPQAAAGAKRSSGRSASTQALPLSQRLSDLFLSFYFLMFLFTVTFTDLHNFTASYLGVDIPQLETMDLVYPPKFLTNLYFKWARTVDPLLYENPMFWQVMEWVNLLCLMPFSAVAIFGFLKGWNRLRNFTLITQSFTFYSLLICIGCTLFGPNKTPDVPMFIAVYIPYLIFPFLAIVRVWNENPFSKPLGWFRSTFISLVSIATFTAFHLYVIKWMRFNETELVGAKFISLYDLHIAPYLF